MLVGGCRVVCWLVGVRLLVCVGLLWVGVGCFGEAVVGLWRVIVGVTVHDPIRYDISQ